MLCGHAKFSRLAYTGIGILYQYTGIGIYTGIRAKVWILRYILAEIYRYIGLAIYRAYTVYPGIYRGHRGSALARKQPPQLLRVYKHREGALRDAAAALKLS